MIEGTPQASIEKTSMHINDKTDMAAQMKADKQKQVAMMQNLENYVPYDFAKLNNANKSVNLYDILKRDDYNATNIIKQMSEQKYAEKEKGTNQNGNNNSYVSMWQTKYDKSR